MFNELTKNLDGSCTREELIYEIRNGKVYFQGQGVKLFLGESDGSDYCDAQIDNYHQSGEWIWTPPIELCLRARFSHPEALLMGTAGFGFWNDPFGMTAFIRRTHWRTFGPLPQAIWFFFGAPPTNMDFAFGVAGSGWKAGMLDASQFWTKILLPLAPLAMVVNNSRWGYRRLWPRLQRLLKIEEKVLQTSMEEWHEYRLLWLRDCAIFYLDGNEVLRAPFAPSGPLGFVAWIDNQYMIATPQGKFKSGLMATGDQWLEIESIQLSRSPTTTGLTDLVKESKPSGDER